MRPPPIALEPTTPWSIRLFDRIPLPPFWAGVAVAVATFAFFLLYTALLGDGPGRLAGVRYGRVWVAEAIQDCFLGFALAVITASLRGARDELEAVRPSLAEPRPDPPDLARDVFRYRRLPLRLAGSIAILTALPIVWSEETWIGGRSPGWSHPTAIWLFARNAVTWWIVLRGMALELELGWRFSRLADRIAIVDPFDRQVFAPFARRALRNVLLWMLLAAWVSLTYVGPGWAIGELLALGLLALASFAIAAFLLPLVGPHRQLRAALYGELARVRTAIRPARDAVLAVGESTLAGGRLADLVAYEARVARASAWPIETATWLRFGSYLALGLGSWVGAGLVERALDSVLR